MSSYIEPIAKLVHELSKLPGVGNKTAVRYAYTIIKMSNEEVQTLASAIVEAKKNTRFCSVCGSITTLDVCEICSKRKPTQICVVKETKDVLAIERIGEFNGQYHVLNGTLSPVDGIGPDDIRIKELVGRVCKGDVEEVILATNPDVEGEVTANYIAQTLRPFGVKITRIAQGVPVGSDLEYADIATLSNAIQMRVEF